jgi:hypothetical protein
VFLEELEPTHVITVRGGKVNMEERGLRESDWDDDLYSRIDSSGSITHFYYSLKAMKSYNSLLRRFY